MADAFANLEHSPQVEQVNRHPRRNLLGARLLLTPNEGKGTWEFTQIGDHIFVVVTNFIYKDPRVEVMPGDGLVQFNFRLSGDLTLGISRSEPLRIKRPSLLVWNQAPGFDIKEWTAPSAHEQCVVIYIQSQYLIEQFLSPLAEIPAQLRPFVSANRSGVNYCQLPLSAEMFELAIKLVKNPYSGALALMHTEAVAMQLICCAVQGCCSITDAANERYSPRDLRCLHTARDYLMKKFVPAPTIPEVARAAGINEATLKRGFKAMFGETLFDFSLRCRMQHALTLLREQHVSVARAAELSGYRHQTSFSTAFQHHFGMRPKDVRCLRSSK
jgi:AraC-like DNA-binding protein